jgi:acetylornithine/succinyldiaminopimelate/putrescine aminotransferase
MFAFEQFDIVPDLLTLGKALGGGMPIGALVAAQQHLQLFTHAPMLGHITTFGGHPMVCAAAAATIEVLKSEINWSELEKWQGFGGIRIEDDILIGKDSPTNLTDLIPKL